MELLRHTLFTDWSTTLIYASALLVIAFLSINFSIWMLNKLPLPPGRRSRRGGLKI